MDQLPAIRQAIESGTVSVEQAGHLLKLLDQSLAPCPEQEHPPTCDCQGSGVLTALLVTEGAVRRLDALERAGLISVELMDKYRGVLEWISNYGDDGTAQERAHLVLLSTVERCADFLREMNTVSA